MNRAHGCLCGSRYWGRAVRTTLAPWVLEAVPPVAQTIEVGPAAGATTAVLLERTETLTCVEIDTVRAQALAARFGDRVRVVCHDAAALPFASDTFDLAVAIAMLHHVPSAAAQNRVLSGLARVLRPGGVLAGYEITTNPLVRALHWFDTMTLIEPEDCAARLTAAGLVDVSIDVRASGYRFRARKPGTLRTGSSL